MQTEKEMSVLEATKSGMILGIFLNYFLSVKRHKKDARISPDTIVTMPTSCPVDTRLF